MSNASPYLDALRRGDRRAAQQVIDRHIDKGGSLRSAYLDIVQPARWAVGRLWQINELSVAEEHLATAITQAVMGRAFERLYEWRDVRTPTLIAACAADERHQLGLRMLCDLLELDGWDTTYLGASVPVESLVDLVEKRVPDAVALSATITPHLPRVRAMIAAIRASTKLSRQPLIIAGGRAIGGSAALAQRLGADFTAADAAEALEVLRVNVRRAA